MTSSGTTSSLTRPSALREILREPVVRQRIIDYLGGSSLESATCTFIGHIDPKNPSRFKRHPSRHLIPLLDRGFELARSLDDFQSLIVHLDIEYVNFDDPAAAFSNPRRAFDLQAPLVRAIERQLLDLDIRYLHVVTGQGHHFVWCVPHASRIARRISRLDIRPRSATQSNRENRFQNLALLMEFLAHRIKSDAAPRCEVPVEITALHVGSPDGRAREMLSIDISEYGDPLASRMIRLPYTAYLKPWLSGLIASRLECHELPVFCTLPLHEMSVSELIGKRHQPETIISLARLAGTRIPDAEIGTANLLDSYLHSDLAGFHRDFHSRLPTASLPADLPPLPPCATHILEQPNDLLLKPSGMLHITRCLLACAWHPSSIATLVTSIFQNPAHQWTPQWEQYDPATRAAFYVRLFAGQINLGIDRGIDFNCVSHQQKQLCWAPHGCSLAPYHARLYQPKPANP
ncbi:MAG: hypothetical protein Q7R22_013095 [Verrucomicrobiota bacterium JB025]|nr:hypothetical protein [Verrucomicrobiota bacterium JB025]